MQSVQRGFLSAITFVGCLALLAGTPVGGLAAAGEVYPTWSSGKDLGADHEAGAALAQVGDHESQGAAPAAGQEAAKKSLLTAGLLGGVVGLGTGQFYSRRWISGAAFFVVDSVLAAYLAKAAIGDEEPVRRSGSVTGAIASAAVEETVDTLAVALLATTLTISHLAQAVWGPLAARQYNKELEQQTAQGWRLGVGVGGDTVRFAASYRY